MSYKLIIGSHVGMSGKNKYLLGSAKEAISYEANALMIYTGAPQNTRRKSTKEMFISEGHQLLREEGIETTSIVIHAPYIVNLANGDPEKREFAISFLQEEYKRTAALGAKIMVLHPGNHLKNTPQQAMDWIIEGLNQIIDPSIGVIIALETMAGKGTEVGKTFEQLKYMIDGVKEKEFIGVCMDTCHMHDAGYDLKNNLDGVLEEFDRVIGLDKNVVMHINDSKNPCGAAKDRHENLGHGEIGFQPLIDIIWHPKTDGIIKILETPWVEDKPPYKEEIEMIKSKTFDKKVK